MCFTVRFTAERHVSQCFAVRFIVFHRPCTLSLQLQVRHGQFPYKKWYRNSLNERLRTLDATCAARTIFEKTKIASSNIWYRF